MNNKVTFPELVEQVAQYANTSKRMSELFLKELFATISQSLIDGESVKVKGIGTFKLTEVSPRTHFGEFKRANTLHLHALAIDKRL